MLTINDIPGLDIKRQRKYGVIELTYDGLAKLLDMPRGMSIVSITDIDTNNSIRIKIIHTDIKETAEGSPLPTISVGQVGWDRIG